MDNHTNAPDADDVKLDGTEQSTADEMKAAYGKVEHKAGQLLDDEEMDNAGDEKVVDHGSIEDVAETIKDHVEEAND